MLKMTEAQIEQFARKFLMEAYGMKLNIPININGRLKRVLGRYVHRTVDGEPLRMEFSKNYLIRGNLDDIKGTIKHECIHYALHQQGKPYKDGTALFESELIKHGSHSTGTLRIKVERNYNLYKCECTVHKKARALHSNGMFHRCGSCKANLTFIGKKKMLA